MNKAAFLDRDGVINQKAATDDGYITRWEDLHFLPGVVEAIALLHRAGFLVIMVTNQRCISKGLLTKPELDSLHRRMCGELALRGAPLDKIYYCPHEEHPPCECRKPAPGMLFAAAIENDLDLRASWMIGDSARDIEAGKRAGCRTARITSASSREDGGADIKAQSLLEATQTILQFEKSPLPPSVQCCDN
jgi:D-glycero-D-manno-heptose 1,7-bisphosphate phosphatase